MQVSKHEQNQNQNLGQSLLRQSWRAVAQTWRKPVYGHQPRVQRGIEIFTDFQPATLGLTLPGGDCRADRFILKANFFF